jgi:nucleoside 2-deoxyribosyltransferase
MEVRRDRKSLSHPARTRRIGSKIRVYLAHPIGDDEDPEVCRALLDLIEKAGLAAYTPLGAFRGVRGEADFIWEPNLLAIRLCDVVIALLFGGPTLGVGAELGLALDWGKQIWVWAPRLYTSSLVQYAASRVFRELPELEAAIIELGAILPDREVVRQDVTSRPQSGQFQQLRLRSALHERPR